MRANGTFEIKLTPQTPDGKYEDALLGRMTFDKQFQGDLIGSSTGHMLTAMTATKGSAGYVAIERVTGTLNGSSGTFVLQHNAFMSGGVHQLNVAVVPDSGTEGLTGLSGKLVIRIEDGRHYYEFEYELPATV
jgi:hypothetical protein